MTRLILALSILLSAARAHAQSNEPSAAVSWRISETVIKHATFVVADERRATHAGRFDVREISTQSATARDSTKNGTIIGAIAGAAYGVVVSVILRGESGEGQAGMAVGLTTTSAGVGALVGYLVDKAR